MLATGSTTGTLAGTPSGTLGAIAAGAATPMHGTARHARAIPAGQAATAARTVAGTATRVTLGAGSETVPGTSARPVTHATGRFAVTIGHRRTAGTRETGSLNAARATPGTATARSITAARARPTARETSGSRPVVVGQNYSFSSGA